MLLMQGNFWISFIWRLSGRNGATDLKLNIWALIDKWNDLNFHKILNYVKIVICNWFGSGIWFLQFCMLWNISFDPVTFASIWFFFQLWLIWKFSFCSLFVDFHHELYKFQQYHEDDLPFCLLFMTDNRLLSIIVPRPNHKLNTEK